jgi:hypothetical protein
MEAQGLHPPEYGSKNPLEFINCRSGEVAVLRYQRTKDAFKLSDEILPHHSSNLPWLEQIDGATFDNDRDNASILILACNAS